MKEIALNLNNNDHRMIGKLEGCFDSNGVFLKKYLHIDGVLCAVDSQGNVLQTYKKTDFEECKNVFGLSESIAEIGFSSCLIKIVNGEMIQPYLFFNNIDVENPNVIDKVKNFLTESEKISLQNYLSRLPSLENCTSICFSPKQSGNWIYLEFNCDFEVQ